MEPGDMVDAEVLLVDDDAEWLAAASASLSDADDALTVLTATGGEEALGVLDSESVDCVVCDYRMPEMDGIEVLERVRDRQGELPFILVTGSGNEGVASRAISAEATDYFVKEPGRDQSGALAKRIRSAVAAHRTREELATERRRFAALFENVPDPVAIVDDDGGIYGLNSAFERTFGTLERDAKGREIDHYVDRASRLREEGTAVADLSRETGEGTRHFLARRFSLGPEGAGYVFTDVTDHRRRQQDLERALSMDAEVRELFLSASNRAELEASFCETLATPEDRLAAVVAEPDGVGGVSVRARAGADLPEANWTAPDSPVVKSLDGDTSQCVRVTEADGEWAASARQAGVRSALAIPIERDGVPDGVFCVYADEDASFEGSAREQIEGLVASLGDAIHLVERMSALAADSVVRVQLAVSGEGPLGAAASEADATLSVEVVRELEDGTAMYVDVVEGDPEGLAGQLRADDRIGAVETVIDGATTRFRVVASGPSLPGVVVENGGSVHELRVAPDGATLTVDVPPAGDVSGVADAVEAAFGPTTVRSIRNHDRQESAHPEGYLAGLTDKQRVALETAFAEGYFESPREQSAEEIAESLSIAGSTFLQHLRTAERKLLASVFGAEAMDEDG